MNVVQSENKPSPPTSVLQPSSVPPAAWYWCSSWHPYSVCCWRSSCLRIECFLLLLFLYYVDLNSSLKSVFIFDFCFLETGFLCSFGACPGTSSRRPSWLRTHRDPPDSASQVLGLKAHATTAPSWGLIATLIYIFVVGEVLIRIVLDQGGGVTRL